MTRYQRTASQDKDFRLLVQELDRELAVIDGEDHAFFAQYNQTDALQFVVVAYQGEVPVACGGLKQYDPTTLEVKRMYTLPSIRNQGIASGILQHLEAWASELKFQRCILETGVKQPDAIHLYEKNGYERIPNFGPYIQQPLSACFQKKLSK